MIPLFESVLSFTDLRAFLAIALKHKRLMVLCGCLGLALGLAYMVFKKPVYFSRALVKVTLSEPMPMDDEVVYRDNTPRSVVSQLRSPHIMERTAASLGINANYRTLVDNYIKLVKVQGNSEGDLEIETYPYEFWIARDWPEALVNEYLAYREEKRFERRERAVKEYTQQMMRIRDKIEEFQTTIADFKDDQNLQERNLKLQELATAPAQLLSIQNKLNMLKPIREKLDSKHVSTLELLSLLNSTQRTVDQLEVGAMVPVGSSTTTNISADGSSVVVTPDLLVIQPWERMERNRHKLQRELKDALKIYLPGHQKVIELKEQIAAIDKELEIELDVQETRFQLEYDNLLAEKSRMEKQMAVLREFSREHGKIKRQLDFIEASRLGWESMYAVLARSLEKFDFGGEAERVSIQYMGLTELKETPISPYRRKVFLYALALGLALAVGVPFLLEYLDDTISFDEQAEKELGLKSIGIIPRNDVEADRKSSIIKRDRDISHRFKEHFRVIRVNLMSNVEFEGQRQVFMIASSLPKEGKSIVALNLSLSFASLGEKTLLIDADLRRGSLHRAFEIPSRPGLGQLLRDESSVENCIIETPVNNLSFLPCGRRHVHSASELLESPAFGDQLRTLRPKYDRIIIDTPPVLGLAETSSIAKLADGVVMVIWSGNTTKKAVKTAVTTLTDNGAKFFGCILNKLDLSAATSYYYYYYYSYKYYQAYQSPAEREAYNARARAPLPERDDDMEEDDFAEDDDSGQNNGEDEKA